MELVLSKEQIGNRNAKYEMNLDDPLDCLMKSREMGVEDWRAKKYLEMIRNARTISTGCKKFDDYQFLLRTLAVSGRDEARIVEQNLQVETKAMHSRLLNPISAMQDRHNYKGVIGDIERLRREGWKIRNLVIHAGYLSPTTGWIDQVWNWWEDVHVGLRRVCRNGGVKAVFSREISVSSLIERTYHPHVHVLYMYKGADPMERFHKFLPGCDISPDMRPVRSVKGLIRYFFGVSTPRQAYISEWSPESSRVVNMAIWEWMDDMKALYYNRKRIGRFGLTVRGEKSSLPSVGEQNKIIEDNYIYEKRTRLSIGCGGRNCWKQEQVTEALCGTGISGESRNGEVEHGGIHQGSRGGVQRISSWIEGGHADGGCRGGDHRGIVQGERRNFHTIHRGSGKGGKSAHETGWWGSDECSEPGLERVETAIHGGCSQESWIHGERSTRFTECGPGS